MSEIRECRRNAITTACVLWIGTQIDNVPRFDEYSVDKHQQKKENKVYMRNKYLSQNWLYAIDGSIHYMYTGVSSIAGVSFNYPAQFSKFLKIHGQKLDDDDNYYLIISALKLANVSNYDKMTGFERFENQNPDIRYIQYLIASISLNRSSLPNCNVVNDLMSDGGITYISSFSSEGTVPRRVKKSRNERNSLKNTVDFNIRNEFNGKLQTETICHSSGEPSNTKDIDLLGKNDCEKKKQSNFEKWLMEANSKVPGNMPLPKAGYDNLESIIKEATANKRVNKCCSDTENNLPIGKGEKYKKAAHMGHQERGSGHARRQSKGRKKSEENKSP